VRNVRICDEGGRERHRDGAYPGVATRYNIVLTILFKAMPVTAASGSITTGRLSAGRVLRRPPAITERSGMQQNHRRLALVRQSNPDPVNHLVGGRRRLSRPLAQTLPDDKPYYSAWTTTRSRTVAKMLAGQLGTAEVPELLQHSHNAVFRITDVLAKIANP
ncbi:MAG: hypothetical protein ACRDQZ_15710, partial [Mycobacteriales bacterium]